MPETILRSTTNKPSDRFLASRAVRLWELLQDGRSSARHTEVLQAGRKSAVCRLIGAEPKVESIIAKRCPTETALVERFVYETILPQLPVPSLRWYGFIEEEYGEFCWFFIEDAAGCEYSPHTPEHRVLASQWLAAIHSVEM